MEDKKVLVIEQSDEDFELFEKKLKKGGYSVIRASDVKKAIELVKETGSEAVVMNLVQGRYGIFTGLRGCKKLTSEIPDVNVLCHSPLEYGPLNGSDEFSTGGRQLNGIVLQNAVKNNGGSDYLKSPLSNSSELVSKLGTYFK